MTLIARDPMQSDFYPTNWAKFTAADPVRSALKRCGVTEFRADIYRWASRYRIAKSFQGVKLNPKAGVHPGTEELLDAMIEVFLVYSAFEQFCTRVLLLKMNEDTDLRTLEAPHGPGSFLARIRAADPSQTFVRFLAENLDEKPAARMKRFIAGGDCNVCFFGKATRHVFAHGVLTPSSGRTNTVKSAEQPAVKIAAIVGDFLLPLMDAEFNRRVVAKLYDRAEP